MSRIQKIFHFLTYQLPDQRALSAKVKRCAFSDYVPPRAWTKDRTTESWAGPRYETKLHVCAVNPSAEQVHAIRTGTTTSSIFSFCVSNNIFSSYLFYQELMNRHGLRGAHKLLLLLWFRYHRSGMWKYFCGLRKDDLDSQHIFVHAASQHS